MCNLVKLILLLVGRNTKLNIRRGKVLSFKKSAREIFYLDLIASNGYMKLKLEMNELDDLFTLRGHLESQTAYFPQPLPQPQEQVILKENVVPVYTPPPPPPAAPAPPAPSAPLTLIYGNEATPLQTDPMWNKGSTIPVRVATKRREESLPQWVNKTAKYEQVSPVKNNLYNLSEEEMGAFFQAM
ncbi:uncharacterized protein LOC134719409 isoform X1 [Mytilus trossulus]|uniref:uncharacterized protein LOC134719406 isoform X1 n=1 Tax=Mytilus trossulus TaxID=6551 RepID=UPI0030060A93